MTIGKSLERKFDFAVIFLQILKKVLDNDFTMVYTV